MTPMGTLDLSLPKKPDPSVLEQFVSPGALVPESSVLKVGEIFCLPKNIYIIPKNNINKKDICAHNLLVRR